MPIVQRRGASAFYEAGTSLAFHFPTVGAEKARLDFTKNPEYGGPTELRSLPQSVQAMPDGNILATSIVSAASTDYPFTWGVLPEGFPQIQRITAATVTLQTDSDGGITGGAALLMSFAFRSFDGVAPSVVKWQELNSIDAVLVEHAITFGAADLTKHPQGVLRRVDTEKTLNASTVKVRLRAESTGQDFGICDVHAIDSAGTDYYAGRNWHLDTDADGVADPWSLITGSATDCDHYGEDAAGLVEWIVNVVEGALKTFECVRPGGGEVFTARVQSPIADIGWNRAAPGVVKGVEILVHKPTS